MKTDGISKFIKALDILRAISLISAGGCLIWACLRIYQSGDQPFSPEAVSAAFSSISAVVYGCLALILLGFLWDLYHAGAVHEPPVERHSFIYYRRMNATRQLEGAPEVLRSQILSLRNRRKQLNRITAAVCCICAAVFLVYSLNGSHFTEAINRSVIDAMAVFGPCLAISFAFCLFSASFNGKSLFQEADLLKQCPKKAAATVETHRRVLPALQSVLFCAALILILIGLFGGGTADVLAKAINICTECIGLG